LGCKWVFNLKVRELVDDMEEGREVPGVWVQYVVANVERSLAVSEEMPGGFFPRLAKIAGGIYPVDKGLMSCQEAVSC
jgi:hypothetical protein